MKNIFLKILILLWLLSTFYNIWNAWKIDFTGVWDATSKISDVSMWAKSWSFETQINNWVTNGFHTFKIAIGWLLVVYLVYCWILMINSLWDNEEDLKNAKRWIRYSLVWLLFVNIPWTLYSMFIWKKTTDDITAWAWSTSLIYQRNLFMNSETFWTTLWTIITFLQIILVAFAVFVIVFAWIKIMLAQWKDDVIKESKSKIINSILWLIFLWILEAWRTVVFTWDIKWKWQSIFATLANLALYFAWPVAIFFLSLAWYYYITAAWNEDKIKKAKSIVINTVLATLILLWMYTFFDDLKSITFN